MQQTTLVASWLKAWLPLAAYMLRNLPRNKNSSFTLQWGPKFDSDAFIFNLYLTSSL